jgi:hypothetical protein
MADRHVPVRPRYRADRQAARGVEERDISRHTRQPGAIPHGLRGQRLRTAGTMTACASVAMPRRLRPHGLQLDG